MVKLDKIYTRGGDGGETSLATGARRRKDDIRVEAFGMIDETLAFWHQRKQAFGTDGNSVIAGRDSHIREDRRIRDQAVREYAEEHGDGALLYLSKYIDERNGEIHARLDRIEEQQQQLLDLLGDRPRWLR